MRQFILGRNIAYNTQATISGMSEGAVGFFYNKTDDATPSKNILTPISTGSENFKHFMLVLKRKDKNGGPVVIPMHINKFSYTKGVYQPAKKFSADITIPAPVAIGEYSIIVALKGVKFNERNKWTASVYVKDTTIAATNLATKLKDAINNNSESSGVTASVSSAKITISANATGIDYEIIPADMLSGVAVTKTTSGVPAYGDAKYVADLANKAAADAGIEYTYQDGINLLYPKYPLDPLAQPNSADTGYTIFTMKFAEPREVKTKDEVINQIVQVAFPTGAGAITTFETICKAIMNK